MDDSSRNRPRSFLILVMTVVGASLLVSACTVSSDLLPRFSITVDPPLKTLAQVEQKPL